MKKLLIPLIILLLIIGYFISRGGEHKAKDAYDSMNQPQSEQMNDNSAPSDTGDDSDTPPPSNTPTPPDGMGNPDMQTPQEPDQASPNPPGANTTTSPGSGAAVATPAAGTPDASTPTSTGVGGKPPQASTGKRGDSKDNTGNKADKVTEGASAE
ncbi:hypothetical protein ACL7TT_14950 [Microbulbifer sp. 2304DJ12-6]|uniref:hypothetical protein n=1 Tax=Microbulbifer sp. 2304DJ12-6 TaxID=3233340 RepID=UPI0039AF49AB